MEDFPTGEVFFWGGRVRRLDIRDYGEEERKSRGEREGL